MKCPYRTVTKTEVKTDPLNTKEVSTASVDFMDCLGSECPYYGVPVQQHRDTGGWRTVIKSKCRRCEA